MNKRKQNLKAGFTIVEVLVVIILLALIAGASGGFHMGTYKRLQAEKAARNFFLAAKYARIMAIERQKPYRIELDTTNGGYFLTTEELNEETEQTEKTIVRDLYSKPVQFDDAVKFENVQIISLGTESTDEQTTIVFLPNGTAQSAVIQIGDGENHYTVNISAATGKAAVLPGTTEEIKITTFDLDQE
ncbi:MAG: GspH/FimT family pseudopilin [Planctomycetota bacterium]|jgi:prepilin-type N-terminal cleavage/methylation domain-containing protein